jgi:hypothetical protein
MRFGSLGRVALPGLFWVSYLRPAVKFAVVVVAILALALRSIDPALLGLVLAATVGVEILVSMSAVLLHDYASQPEGNPSELSGLFLAAIQEQLGYRLWRSFGAIGHGRKHR